MGQSKVKKLLGVQRRPQRKQTVGTRDEGKREQGRRGSTYINQLGW